MEFGCTICERQFSTREDCDSHIEVVHKFFPCTKCGKVFNAKYWLNYHLRNGHKKDRTAKCPYCSWGYLGDGSSMQLAFLEHKMSCQGYMERSNAINMYCNLCQVVLPSHEQFREHVNFWHKDSYSDMCLSQAQLDIKIEKESPTEIEYLSHENGLLTDISQEMHIKQEPPWNDDHSLEQKMEFMSDYVNPSELIIDTGQDNEIEIDFPDHLNVKEEFNKVEQIPLQSLFHKCVMCHNVYYHTEIEKHLWKCKAKLPCLSKIIVMKWNACYNFHIQHDHTYSALPGKEPKIYLKMVCTVTVIIISDCPI